MERFVSHNSVELRLSKTQHQILKYCLQAMQHCNRIDGEMVCTIASSVVDRGVGSSLIRVKLNYTIGIWCFYANHIVLKIKDKDWLNRKQSNVFEWRGLLFQ